MSHDAAHPRPLSQMGPVLEELTGQLAQVGLALAVFDAEGNHLGESEPPTQFCHLLRQSGHRCSRGHKPLVRKVLETREAATASTSLGCCQIAVPILHRRRLIGVAVAFCPVREMIGSEPLARECARLGLDAERLCRQTAEDLRHSRRQAEDLIRIVQWLLEAAVEKHRGEAEIRTLSLNLSATYEELSLVYRISGQMEVTQDPQAYFREVCEEVREVLGVGCVLATIDPTRAADADADAQVVFSGEADLNADQVRMLISTALAERIADGEPAVDNDFSPPSGSGLGTAVSNLIAAPMTHDGNRLGVLLAINREGDDFDSVDLKLVGALASQGAVFLANSRLYAELQDLLMGVLHALSSAIDAKDPYTSGHSQRVARLSRRLAEAAGLGAEKARHVYLCGLLHDIGKIGVPESVLCKAGKLTDEEYTVIKRHPSVGAKILQGIRHLEGVIEAILTHHERPDGRGYPRGLVGEQIPLEGRIVGLADVFDAMTSDRTYRKALPLGVVAEEIRSCAGTQFDTGLAELLLSMDLDALREELYLDGPEDLLGNARRHKELTRWT